MLSLTDENCTGPGQCLGTFLTEVDVFNMDECLGECHIYKGPDFDGDGEPDQFCSWFTYDSVAQSCELYSSCENLGGSCSSCISGSINCGPTPAYYAGKTLVMYIIYFVNSHITSLFQNTQKSLSLEEMHIVLHYQVWS